MKSVIESESLKYVMDIYSVKGYCVTEIVFRKWGIRTSIYGKCFS